MDALAVLDAWPVDRAAAAVVTLGGRMVATRGDLDAAVPIASLTKLLTAAAVHLAVEEGSLTLDEPATDAGASVADLLAHAGGLGPDGGQLAPPGSRRIYSNAGYDVLADLVAARTGLPLARYLAEGVCEPTGMTGTELVGPAGHGARSTVRDLARLVAVLATPGLLAAETVAHLRRAHRPDLGGVLPGYGRHQPNPWGLGPEIRGHKQPHWTGTRNDPTTFGHFGRSGALWWVDPAAGLALVCLTDRPFGEWALARWPALADAVLAHYGPAPS